MLKKGPTHDADRPFLFFTKFLYRSEKWVPSDIYAYLRRRAEGEEKEEGEEGKK